MSFLPFRTLSLSLLLLLLLMATALVMNAEAVADVEGLSEVFWDALGTVSVGQVVQNSLESGLNQSCFDPNGRYSNLKTCLVSQCVSGDDVAKLYGVTSEQPLDKGNLSVMSPGLMYVLTQKDSCSSEIHETKERPSEAAVWGYGFLFVTLINLCSLFGACVLPCVRAGIYKGMLLFMVALAVGTLVGSGLLVLIPEALELPEKEEGHGFVWKATTVMGGIYLFFLMERIMRMINNRRENTKEKKERDKEATEGTYNSFFHLTTPENPSTRLKDPDHLPGAAHNQAFSGDDGTAPSSGDLNATAEAGDGTRVQDGGERNATKSSYAVSPPEGGHRVKVAPVAYMIIFGDALHNLIDGLSIGAAFTDSTLLGISLSVAVMCEELPHELGDFAILLNSGMSMRKALLFNFLSSLSCYVGLIIGIQLGENTTANTWIFAIAGGMFLYISLADMLPEMNSAAESEDGKNFGEIKTFLVQNFGLLFGFGIILLLAVYGEKIQF